MTSLSARRSLILTLLGALFVGVFLSSGYVSAQTRDHLTEQETELVRFHQELDKRMEIFIKSHRSQVRDHQWRQPTHHEKVG